MSGQTWDSIIRPVWVMGQVEVVTDAPVAGGKGLQPAWTLECKKKDWNEPCASAELIFFLPWDGGCQWTWRSAWSCCLSWTLVWIRHSAKMPSCQWLGFRASCFQKYPSGCLQKRVHESFSTASWWLFTGVFSLTHGHGPDCCARLCPVPLSCLVCHFAFAEIVSGHENILSALNSHQGSLQWAPKPSDKGPFWRHLQML